MSKTLRDQLVDLGLVSEVKARAAAEAARARENHACFQNAMVGVRRVDRDHRAVVVEYRRHREIAL